MNGCLLGASNQLPARLCDYLGRGQMCTGELVVKWEEKEGVCSSLVIQMCSRLILTLPWNASLASIYDILCPLFRVTKKSTWYQQRESFVGRRISFANIQKIMIIVIDRGEWKEYTEDFNSWPDIISTSLNVYHVLCMVSFHFYNHPRNWSSERCRDLPKFPWLFVNELID